MASRILEVARLEKSYDGVRVLAGFSCLLREREILGLIGPNGAGKTTFFNVMSGFVVPDSGMVLFEGRDLTAIPAHRIANLGISRTFQDIRLIRQISVLDNVLLSFHGQAAEKLRNVFFNWRQSLAEERANREEGLRLLAEVGLDRRAADPAEELSYGQQKLLNLMCCLAASSKVLLLDEPVAGIAPAMAEKILSIIRELPAKNKSVIMIEHNLDAVTEMCDRVIFMNAGAKVSEGKPEEVKNDPRVIEAYIE